jgi:mannose-1-phosphate guanylyltransferase
VKSFESVTPKTAFVLGAGLGTRLRPLTNELPKPLLPVAGRPMIESCFERLRAAGVRRIIVNTHWKPEAYAKAYRENRWRDVELVFVHEPVLLETGGGLKNIEPLLGPDDDHLWIYNGDIFAEPDLEKLWADHAASGAEATLLLRDSGNVKVDTNGAILDLRGRLGVTAGEARQFSGISLVSRPFFRHLRAGVIESLVEGWLRALVEKPGSVRGVTDSDFRWADLGTIAEYETICADAS